MIFDENRRLQVQGEIKKRYEMLNIIQDYLASPPDDFQKSVDKLLGLDRKESLEHSALHVIENLIELKKQIGEDTSKEQGFFDEFKDSAPDCFDYCSWDK